MPTLVADISVQFAMTRIAPLCSGGDYSLTMALKHDRLSGRHCVEYALEFVCGRVCKTLSSDRLDMLLEDLEAELAFNPSESEVRQLNTLERHRHELLALSN